jgi:hypothetical protein
MKKAGVPDTPYCWPSASPRCQRGAYLPESRHSPNVSVWTPISAACCFRSATGVWPSDLVLSVMLANYALKVGWEAVMTPLTYRVVNFLKRAEHEDYFDRQTDFTPFSLQT